MTPSDDNQLPSFHVSTKVVPGDLALAQFEQAVQDVFALRRPNDEPYAVEIVSWHMGTIMVGSFRSSALSFHRSAELVGSSGLDHVLVQLYQEGGFDGHAGDRAVRVEAGDIVVFDLTQTLQTTATDFQNISLLLPRALFGPGDTGIAQLHGLVLPASSPMTGMLASYLTALAERAGSIGRDEALVAARSTAALVTTLLAARIDEHAAASPSSPSPVGRINAAIDRHLRDPDFDASRLSDALGMSRATLYRTFESIGGIADYIRHRRLTLAAVALAAPENHSRKIADIAFNSGFASLSAFNRAFKTAFGIPASEARKRSVELWSSKGDGLAEPDSREFVRWMRTLRA